MHPSLPSHLEHEYKINITKTGRKMELDRDWTALPAGAQGFHSFLYDSDVEFILIRTDSEVRFQRIAAADADVGLADFEWDFRADEHYYIFKLDPAQKVIVVDSLAVRFFRFVVEEGDGSMFPTVLRQKTRSWRIERGGRPWEAEDVYKERDVVADESFPPEHLAELARRFKAWRATSVEKLFVFLLVPERMSEREEGLLRERGVRVINDVSWGS